MLSSTLEWHTLFRVTVYAGIGTQKRFGFPEARHIDYFNRNDRFPAVSSVRPLTAIGPVSADGGRCKPRSARLDALRPFSYRIFRVKIGREPNGVYTAISPRRMMVAGGAATSVCEIANGPTMRRLREIRVSIPGRIDGKQFSNKDT